MGDSGTMFESPVRPLRSASGNDFNCPPTPVKSLGRKLFVDFSDGEDGDDMICSGGEQDVAEEPEITMVGSSEEFLARQKRLPPPFPNATDVSPRSTPPRLDRDDSKSVGRFRNSTSSGDGMISPHSSGASTPRRVLGKRRWEGSARNASRSDFLRSPFRHTPPPPPNFNPFSPVGRKCAKTDEDTIRTVDPAYSAAATRASLALSRYVSSSICDSTAGSCLSEDDGELTSWFKPSRYKDDFEEIEEIGKGSFGRVFKCQNRLDGWMYAVKCTKKKIRGRGDMQYVLKEVYALAALSNNPHVVQYYSAWIEDDYLYIQTELVEGGSLYSRVFSDGLKFSEDHLKTMLLHLASGLKDFHNQNLVHLDIKPENLYLTKDGVYKYGDLGLTMSAENVDVADIAEGDPRSLAQEILEGSSKDLKKADIFSLGLSAYELITGKKLPSNGEKWHALRRQELPGLENLDPNLQLLLKSMVDPDPAKRPSADQILMHESLYKGNEEFLFKELMREKGLRMATQEKLTALEGKLAH